MKTLESDKLEQTYNVNPILLGQAGRSMKVIQLSDDRLFWFSGQACGAGRRAGRSRRGDIAVSFATG